MSFFSFNNNNSVVRMVNGNVTTTINGKTFSGNNSIEIRNNTFYIDGNKVEDDGVNNNKIIVSVNVTGDVSEISGTFDTIHVVGNVKKLNSSSGDVSIEGNADDVNTGSGSVNVGNVNGNISTGSGSVNVKGNIAGNVRTGSGSVRCGSNNRN